MKKLQKSMPMLPGFYLPMRGRKPRSAQQILEEKIDSLKRKSFKQIGQIFERFILRKLLQPEQSGAMSRRRVFSKETTFLGFLWASFGCRWRL